MSCMIPDSGFQVPDSGISRRSPTTAISRCPVSLSGGNNSGKADGAPKPRGPAEKVSADRHFRRFVFCRKIAKTGRSRSQSTGCPRIQVVGTENAIGSPGAAWVRAGTGAKDSRDLRFVGNGSAQTSHSSYSRRKRFTRSSAPFCSSSVPWSPASQTMDGSVRNHVSCRLA